MPFRLADDRTFTAQRTAAVSLVLIQATALWLLMDAPVFALCAAAIALAGWVAPRHHLVRGFSLKYWGGAIGVVFAIKSVFAPAEFEFTRAFMNTPLSYEIAGFCLILQLLVLFTREYVVRLPLWLLGVSVVGLIFTGDVRLTGIGRTGMLVLVPLYVLSWISFAAASRRPVSRSTGLARRVRMGLMVLVAMISLGLGTAGAVLLRAHERELEQAIAAYLALGLPNQTGAGFSGRGGLSDVSAWKSVLGEQVTLQVKSARAPGYLRGRVFDYFRGDVWRASLESRPLPRVDQDHQARISTAAGNLFLLERWQSQISLSGNGPAEVGAWLRDQEKLVVWPLDVGTEPRLFLPLETVALACPGERLMLDQHGTLFRTDHTPRLEYTAWIAESAQPDGRRVNFEELLQLPENLHPDVRVVADEVFFGASTFAEKVRAVVAFFHDNFEYQLGVRIPGHADRLAWFLTHKPPAHCEYFATASAILLRLEGIPTRYVTGFHVSERNAVSGNWTARRRDAHAWVEAYDAQQQRWVIVEATPPGGVPAPVPASFVQQFQEAGAHAIRQLRGLVRRGDWYRMLQLALIFVGLLAGGGLLGHGSWWLVRRLGRRCSRPVWHSEQDSRLIRERRRMDRFLARRGLRRSNEETVSQFAGRLKLAGRLKQGNAVARWYHRYLALRFGGRTVPEDAVNELREERRRLTQ